MGAGCFFILVSAWSRILLAAFLCLTCPVAMGDEPRAVPMPEVVEPAEDRLVVGVVHRVIDGDSVELFLNGRVVAYELAGADAPEVLDGLGVVLRGSVEAKAYLVGLVDGEQIAVLPDARRPTDVRGRRRGYLYRMPDRLFVNLEMIRLGHAKHARDPMGFNHPVMKWAQGRARDAHKGVWARMPVTVTPAPLVTGSEAAVGSVNLWAQGIHWSSLPSLLVLMGWCM